MSGITVLVSFLGSTALFALLYRVPPDVHLRWRDVTTGACVMAVLFTIGQQVIGLYLGQSSVASSYGAAGSIMILLLWVYYSAKSCCWERSSRSRTRCARVFSPFRSHSLNRTLAAQGNLKNRRGIAHRQPELSGPTRCDWGCTARTDERAR